MAVSGGANQLAKCSWRTGSAAHMGLLQLHLSVMNMHVAHQQRSLLVLRVRIIQII
jgi:hypothetical protein